ncbi:CPBP family intramembrane glutamic endopeptidase [Chondromyces crocatus]|uniref:CAAX prenyl protease 2/Lysostaphin resistance protein A-like domain-containing protein n=1 Tax=Chondromyces crocatus TaxID=52 RepID=A0A0K1EAE0_CHOCO|nr:type II CAAX endopeptidase family protein [Chondromyces crocatus]AKT37632.1 uncharacterized protein CMC5_017740 [Chondromyces crocatus]
MTQDDAVATGARFPQGSRAHLLHALSLVALCAGLAVGSTLLARTFYGGDLGLLSGSPASFAALGAQVALVVVIGWGWLLRFGRVSLRDLGFRDLSVKQLLLGIAAVVPSLVCIGSMLTMVGMTPPALLDAILAQPWQARLLCLGVGLVTAVAEESVFRGYLQPSLAARLGMAGGVIGTALLFSMIHLSQSWAQVASRFLLGLIFGLLRGGDQPLWAPVIAHTLVWVVIGPV